MDVALLDIWGHTICLYYPPRAKDDSDGSSQIGSSLRDKIYELIEYKSFETFLLEYRSYRHDDNYEGWSAF